MPVPGAPLVTVIQEALLVAVQVALAGVAVTATVPVLAAAPTLADAGESVNAGPACDTETDCPAMVNEPDRLAAVLAAAE